MITPISKLSLLLRNFSTGSAGIKKSVFVSQSNDIFTNLALEDWIYKNYNFADHHVLMLWRNDPCVVIGRHQNPWLEANVSEANLARRNSGGGTVYHDRGNLNLTFFTPRSCYNRRTNLELIARALADQYGIQSEISKREDLTVDSKKVSGTASKLGSPSAYHHCTLLVHVDKVDLSIALQKDQLEIETNATQSIRSPIINLREVEADITVEGVQSAVAWEYLGADNIQLVHPVEEAFPGITEIRNTFASWEWRFGRTPKFTAVQSVGDFRVKMTVENGKICEVQVPVGYNENLAHLNGQKFVSDVFKSLKLQSTQQTCR